ncbi:LYR motif-containing protein 2 isoform X1 [Microtus ochrogaster]|uniref:LYR motif-containing protein 2 n=1 Tax=Microtus ochrogaster TaxID=79684 RepID=A0ABM0LA28_MICOH|nr:LYR motif-containing protein 2 isoform X1 [Microtus ochrogaster]
MASSCLPPGVLTLKQFMRRQQVLLLYRKIFRAIRQVPSEADRKYLQDWAREEFKRNKSATEEVCYGFMTRALRPQNTWSLVGNERAENIETAERRGKTGQFFNSCA